MSDVLGLQPLKNSVFHFEETKQSRQSAVKPGEAG